MLAVQRSNGMGSSKPPDLEMPFGYSFGTDTNFEFPSPTAPASGPPLLGEDENNYLTRFFDGVGSDDLNYDFFTSTQEAFLNPGWHELPPTYMGVRSSYGHQSTQSQPQQQPPVTSSAQDLNYGAQDMSYKAHDISFSDMNGHMGMGNGLPSTTSPDVVAAAATLVNNGQNGRSHSMASDSMFNMNRDNHHMGTINGHNLHPSIFPSPQSGSVPGIRPQSHDNYVHNTYYADLVFGENAPANIAAADDILQPKKASNVDIRWGSDSGFGNEQGFVPPPDQETTEELERNHLRKMKNAITPIYTADMVSSNDDTRPSSPHRKKTLSKTKADDEDARSRKRRKSKHTEDDEDEDEPTAATSRPSVKKRKSVGKASSPAVTTESNGKRKKSTAAATAATAATAAAAKAARENLTEDQKRENHIKSEQKRRTLIREGFDDLGELVPGLRGGGFSKSAVLEMAATWLDEVLRDNEALKRQLTDLERGR